MTIIIGWLTAPCSSLQAVKSPGIRTRFSSAGRKNRLLNLQPGSMNDVRLFTIDHFDIALTICRDTYHEDWEEFFPPADLWIDIKANELPYTMEYYAEALPSRLKNSKIRKGLTVSLAGKILGYQFTGPTEYIDGNGVLSRTDPYGNNSVMVMTLNREGIDPYLGQ